MRLINADALEYHKQLECMGNGQYEDVKVVYECDIDNAPTIDAIEVVRCKNCRKHKTYSCPFGEYDFPGDYMYCYYGERKAE